MDNKKNKNFVFNVFHNEKFNKRYFNNNNNIYLNSSKFDKNNFNKSIKNFNNLFSTLNNNFYNKIPSLNDSNNLIKSERNYRNKYNLNNEEKNIFNNHPVKINIINNGFNSFNNNNNNNFYRKIENYNNNNNYNKKKSLSVSNNNFNKTFQFEKTINFNLNNNNNNNFIHSFNSSREFKISQEEFKIINLKSNSMDLKNKIINEFNNNIKNEFNSPEKNYNLIFPIKKRISVLKEVKKNINETKSKEEKFILDESYFNKNNNKNNNDNNNNKKHIFEEVFIESKKINNERSKSAFEIRVPNLIKQKKKPKLKVPKYKNLMFF